MKQQINFINLMSERSEVGESPTRFTSYHDGDKPKLLSDGQISFLFVLQGELRLLFNKEYCAVMISQQMIVVDKFQLRGLQCVGDTVILECVESSQMLPIMQSVSKIFNEPCSYVVFLNVKLEEWCEDMLVNLLEQPRQDSNYHYGKCRKLTSLLLEYSKDELGTLYIPLYACSRHCDRCPKSFLCCE